MKDKRPQQLFKGYLDKNGRFWPKFTQPMGGPVPDFTAFKGSQTEFYLIPVDSQIGDNITNAVGLYEALRLAHKLT